MGIKQSQPYEREWSFSFKSISLLKNNLEGCFKAEDTIQEWIDESGKDKSDEAKALFRDYFDTKMLNLCKKIEQVLKERFKEAIEHDARLKLG